MSCGIIGLGKMGYNLALNIQKNNDIHVYNRSPKRVQELVKQSPGIHGHESICEMLSAMESPRTVITMLPHGEATDAAIQHMVKTLNPADTIIDCSNEHYRTSRNRGAYCGSRQINYLGAGVSGGAMGALNGPSVMIGGNRLTFENNKNFLESFCKNVTYMGPGYGDGHYTKMVHNGIEYGMLQGMADVFTYCNQDQRLMMDVLDGIMGTEIDGYITNCAYEVLNRYEIYKISDVAEMNSTGLWCSQVGLEYAIPTPVINSAVNARITSRYVKSIETAQKPNIFIDCVLAKSALRFVFAQSILEGYELMSTRDFDKKDVTKAWSTATIIECPLIGEDCYQVMRETVDDVRVFVMHCARCGIPCPAIAAALNHYDFTHQRRTSMNFLMAQRNYFGQHQVYEA